MSHAQQIVESYTVYLGVVIYPPTFVQGIVQNLWYQTSTLLWKLYNGNFFARILPQQKNMCLTFVVQTKKQLQDTTSIIKQLEVLSAHCINLTFKHTPNAGSVPGPFKGCSIQYIHFLGRQPEA